MKIYAIIATIVAVIALGLAGFYVYRYQTKVPSLEKEKSAVEADMNSAKSELSGMKTAVENIRTMTIALDASVNSFQPTGDTTIGTFYPTKATTARQKIGDVTDEKDRDMLLINWDQLHNSSRLNDFQALMQKFAENFTRSLNNIKPQR